MTTLQLKKIVQPECVRLDIPLGFEIYFRGKQKGWVRNGDELTRDVVIVYNGVDRWNTIIDPKGLRTDTSTVTVDYNHNRLHTGAYLDNFRVESQLEVPGVDGEPIVLNDVLIATMHIPKTAQMYYLEGRRKRSNGSLYEAALRGELPAVSVDFKPVPWKDQKSGKVMAGEITDTKTGIVTYRYWDLSNVSLLDITPGQQFSGFVRMLRINNVTAMLKKESKVQLQRAAEVIDSYTKDDVEYIRLAFGDNTELELPAEQANKLFRMEDKPEDSENEPDDKSDNESDDPMSEMRKMMEEMRKMCDDTKRMYDELKGQTRSNLNTDELVEKITNNVAKAINLRQTEPKPRSKLQLQHKTTKPVLKDNLPEFSVESLYTNLYRTNQ